MAKSPRRARRENLTKMVLQRCAAPIREHKIPIGKKIQCGAQGCTFHSKRRGMVVKVTPFDHPVATAPRGRRPSPDDRDALRDMTGAAWAFKHKEHLAAMPEHPGLPRVEHIAVLKKCLDQPSHSRKRNVPVEAFVTEREDLRDLPPAWKRAARPAMKLIESLEDAVARRGEHPRSWARRHRADIERLRYSMNAIAAKVFNDIFDLELWLIVRGAMLFDLHIDNIGIRRVKGRVFIVVRDTGCIVRRHQEDWSDRLLRRWAGSLGGYAPGAD